MLTFEQVAVIAGLSLMGSLILILAIIQKYGSFA